jgi:hypothetical protein
MAYYWYSQPDCAFGAAIEVMQAWLDLYQETPFDRSTDLVFK